MLLAQAIFDVRLSSNTAFPPILGLYSLATLAPPWTCLTYTRQKVRGLSQLCTRLLDKPNR